jgi:hypothetical protein
MLYYELGFGYNFQPKTQKVSLAAGVGREFLAPNTRLFLQIDWGAEQRLIDFGIAARGNYTSILGIDLFTLEPAIQGKIKIRNFRIVNQFGYSIPLKKNQQYMKPILTLGIEYVLSRSTDNNTLPKATQN